MHNIVHRRLCNLNSVEILRSNCHRTTLSVRSMASLKRKAGPLAGSLNDQKKPKKDGSLTSFFGAPKPVVPAAASNGIASTATVAALDTAVKFNKEKWVAGLTDEQKTLLKLEIDTLDPSWLAHLKDELTSSSFLDLKRFLQKEIDSGKKVFPPLDEVYSWSRHTPLHAVKVVVVGQDPYHNLNQAHGLCFSVRPPTVAPPSLNNIFAACEKDIPGFKRPPNKGGLLTPWADQGVLLLNTVLTVRAHEANSHQGKGWERFTQKVIDTVVKVRQRGVVFLAWGKPAQKRVEGIKGNKHLVLRGIHPSPLAARAGNFADCGHFKKTNEWLRERYTVEGEVDWSLAADKQKPIKGPDTEQSIKATEDQEKAPKEDGPVTELPEKGEKKTADPADFEDDLDAIEAIEEMARSSQANGDVVGAAGEKNKSDDTRA